MRDVRNAVFIPLDGFQAACANRPKLNTIVFDLRNPVTFGREPKLPPVNFRITDDRLGEGGQKTKYANNLDAIRLLKRIESESRHASSDEQAILSRYVGWSVLPQAFDARNGEWSKEYSAHTEK